MQEFTAKTIYETYLLHVRADRALRALVGAKLEAFKITMMEWLLLSVVCDGPPTGVNMSAIAQTLDVTLPQVTALTNKLLNLKLVKQKTQTHDRRTRHILATSKGKNLLSETEATLSDAMSSWLAGIPADQYAQYSATIKWFASHRSTVPTQTTETN